LFNSPGKTQKAKWMLRNQGTGTGADQIAPLAGIGWVLNDKNFIVTLVQYFHSWWNGNAQAG
jgi:hypothetical protein